MTTEQQLRGEWNTIAGNVKQKYGRITDDELQQIKGNVNQLIGLIQRKSGESREQAQAYVNTLLEEVGTVSERVSQYAQSTGEAVHDAYQQVAHSTREGYQSTSEAVAHRPMESVLAAFGVGLLTGIAIGLSVGAHHRPQPTWHDRFSR